MNFTPSQLAAVDLTKIRQDTCVVAGPGSGKTAVLVECYRRLVVEAGVPPTRLLAITFTERAARSMKQKLAKEFAGSPDWRRQLEQANVSTVHGYCARLLRENAIFAGVDPQFRVLEARQAALLQKRAVEGALDAAFEREPDNVRELTRALVEPEIAPTLTGLYDAVRSAGIAIRELDSFQPQGVVRWRELSAAVAELQDAGPILAGTVNQRAAFASAVESSRSILDLPDSPVSLAHFQALARFDHKGKPRDDAIGKLLRRIKKDLIPAVRQTLISEYYAPQREMILSILADFERRYWEAKAQLGGLDFSDLETFAVRLLHENDDLRERVRAAFDHVLMDEFQDTNLQQAKLLNLLRPPDGFYAVGDINQSIYGFRHANPDVFLNYRDSIEAQNKHLVELEENWRSRADILRAVQTITDGAAGIEPRDLIASRELPVKAQPSVEVIAAISRDIDLGLEIEAAWVARRIREMEGTMPLAGGTATFGDIAVLLRNSEVLPIFSRAFEDAGIPYLASQGKGFFETREVLDLTQLLRVLDNPRDEISLAAVLRSPFVAVSDEALFRLKQQSGLAGALNSWEHWDTSAFTGGDREKLGRFRGQLRRWRDIRDSLSFDRVLLKAMEATGYPWQPGTRTAANIEKFLALARVASSRPLSQFVEELEWFREADTREPEAPPEDSVNAVRVMTVHGAKGLEFPVVFLCAMHKGINDKLDRLAFSPQAGMGVSWFDPVTQDHGNDWFRQAIEEEREQRKDHESNRLLYVAMTRAEEHLVLSFSAEKEWGLQVLEALGVDLSRPGEDVHQISTPNGETFAVRVLAVDQMPEGLARAMTSEPVAPVELLAQPAVSGQHDSTASVTDVSLFAECPRKYYLDRYLGWEPNRPVRTSVVLDDDDESLDRPDATELGTEVHQLLAGDAVDNASAEARRLADGFRASPLGCRAARATAIRHEWDFLMDVEDVVLRGQIDLWFEEGGELVLVDYKSDKVDSGDAQAHAQAYAPQLRLYAQALERAIGRAPDQAFVYLLRPNMAVPIDLRGTLFDNLDDLVRSFRDAQSSLTFPLREGKHCHRCSFYSNLCPAGTIVSGVRDIVRAAAVDGEDLRRNETGFG